MSKDLRWTIFIIIVLNLVCAFVFLPIPNKPLGDTWLKNVKITLGIDLNGGYEGLYRCYDPANPSAKVSREDAQAACDIIRNRIEKRIGAVKEPKINVQSGEKMRIQIQVAGVDRAEWDQYKNLVSQMGKLEIKEVADARIQEEAKKNEWQVSSEYEVLKQNDQDRLVVRKDPIIEGKHIKEAKASRNATMDHPDEWRVDFILKSEGVRPFADATTRLSKKNPQGQLAIILDHELKSHPSVLSPITEGHGQITGGFIEKSADELAIILQTGSLPIALGRVDDVTGKPTPGVAESEALVGPSLGQDAIQRGVLAVGLSIALVALFMFVYYRGLGAIGVVCLGMNLLFLMTIMAFFGMTLTLPGIAGLALTVGMAVDANILINERIREEQAKGKTSLQAFEHGHDRAFVTIIDSHVTQLIAAMVLYFMGSGPVKGFAVTLSVGIVTTLFTVLYCGRAITKSLLQAGKFQVFRMMTVFHNANYNFVGLTRVCVTFSALISVGAFIIFFASGLFQFTGAFPFLTVPPQAPPLGFDFSGGCMVSFELKQTSKIKVVRSKIGSIKDGNGNQKYSDAEVQIMNNEAATQLASVAKFNVTESRQFQLRTGHMNLDEVKKDLIVLFTGVMNREPIELFGPEALTTPAEKTIFTKEAGGGFYCHFPKDKFDADTITTKIKNMAKTFIEKNEDGIPFILVSVPEPIGDQARVKVIFTKEDMEVGKSRDLLYKQLYEKSSELGLSTTPFLATSSIGPAVAEELKNTTFWALIISWVLIIVYLWVRFYSFKFGAAAVVALIHDAIMSLGFVVLCGMIVPKTWGLSFDLNLSTVAAILTIVGYSVNDTIVVFDRIRENIFLMKRATFAEIVNVSVNQTLSRTIWTSFTAWISAICLYVVTMTSSSGVSGLAFPLVIGIIVGTYSSIYIAAPLVMLWYKGQRPVFEKS